MLSVTVICIGKLKEEFWRSASQEYQKRLSRFCSLKIRELDEVRISDNPSDSQIATGLKKEAELILKEIPKDAFTVALCIEGKQISSEELSKKIDAGCTNTVIDQIFASVDDLIDGKLVCGAGGGGFLQIVLKKNVTKEAVHKRLKEVFGDSDIDIWDCTLL